jgi:hypothetical protein
MILRLGICNLLYLYLAIRAANHVARVLPYALHGDPLPLTTPILGILAHTVLELGAVLVVVLMTRDLAE